MNYSSEFVKNFVEIGIKNRFGQEGLLELRKLKKIEAEKLAKAEAKAKIEAEAKKEAEAEAEAKRWTERHNKISELRERINAKKYSLVA